VGGLSRRFKKMGSPISKIWNVFIATKRDIMLINAPYLRQKMEKEGAKSS